MKLYDWLSIDKGSYDCYDTDIDESVTIDWIDKPKSDYDFFVVGLLKKVDIEQKTDDCTLVCDWSKLIRENFTKFKRFTKEYWARDYKDEYDFIYQWIRDTKMNTTLSTSGLGNFIPTLQDMLTIASTQL